MSVGDSEIESTDAAAAPSGRVTFVFTDIEGSTRMFRRLGENYPPLLDRHHAILRRAWRHNGGYEVKTEGDAFLVAFDDPASAVGGCVEGQRLLMSEPWPGGERVLVRMGVHTGLAWPKDGDYIAFALHQAARVVDTAHGGQIIVSAETAKDLSDDWGDWRLRTCGRYRVRDFDEPLELFQVAGTGLRNDLPPLRVLPADGHNMIGALSSLVGRDADLVMLDELVRADRMITILGSGGLGKTRLAIEYGIRHAPQWQDGAWFIDLSPLSDATEIEIAIAGAVGVSLQGGADASTAVLEHLRIRRALLILDNCEQFVAGAARCVDSVLTACPGVSVLCTSRELLGLRYERAMRIQPLDPTAEAAQLFCDRANLDRDAASDAHHDIVALCQALDGLPLAIELAAARCDVMTPAEIRARLDRQDLLRSHDRNGPIRSRSLEDTIRWSYDLLNDAEQQAFRCLGVFAAGFGLEEATAAVAGAALDPYDVPELVWSLVSKSVVSRELAGGSSRYRLLETVREFARRQLDHQLDRAAERVAQYYARTFGPGVEKVDSGLLTERRRDIENVRYLTETLSSDQADLAQVLAWIVLEEHRRTSPRAGLDEALRLLASLPRPTPVRAGLLAEAAGLAADHGDLEHATRLLDEAQATRDKVGTSPWISGRIEQQRGVIALQHGDPELASRIALDALGSVTEIAGRARTLNLLGMAYVELGRFDDARATMQQALALADERADSAMRSGVLSNLAEIELRAGRRASSAGHQLECLDVALQLGSTQDVVYGVIVAARLAVEDGHPGLAARLQSAADATLDAIGLSLYPSDRLLCDELLARSSEQLGESEFERARAAGRSADIVDLVRDMRAVLEAAAAS